MMMRLQQSGLDGSKMDKKWLGLCTHRHHLDTHQHHLSKQLDEIKVLTHSFSVHLFVNHIDVFLSSIKTKAPTNIQSAVL